MRGSPVAAKGKPEFKPEIEGRSAGFLADHLAIRATQLIAIIRMTIIDGLPAPMRELIHEKGAEAVANYPEFRTAVRLSMIAQREEWEELHAINHTTGRNYRP